jgi:hypothetical protein
MDSHFFFLLGLAFILTHEMDAIKAREWTIFPLISRLDNKTGYLGFTALHMPLYLLLFWALLHPAGLNRGARIGLDIFLIVHVFLHLLYLRHPENRFTSVFSWVIIAGAGAAGLLDLIIGI